MDIVKAQYLISSPSVDLCPAPDRPEFAFIGRSNVGKSSLINMLTGQSKLAKTSASPGKTQMINHFEVLSGDIPANPGSQFVKWYLVDLPGYGYAKVSISERRKWEQMISGYFANRQNLSHAYVLIDSRHSPQKIDLEFLHALRALNVNFSIVFTKSDKENQRIVSKNVNEFIGTLKKTWPFLPQHFITSSEKKTGRNKLLGHIHEIISELK